MASSEEYRQKAVARLEAAQGYNTNSPARQTALAEAQVYATLALSAPPAAEAETDAPPTPARERRTRSRKKAAPADEALPGQATIDEVVPGSEEDLIRQEGAK
ncbi:tail assembly protein [Arthrobacter phage SWEP2]|uniref:Tail assembly protein n=1 Tax=Arthrobacter phage SWEP2 TaxID=2945958 RepID=A0A9E7MIC4_9CAUD|nr:tail assembly protein [Arthrobacter phage SWEP2]